MKASRVEQKIKALKEQLSLEQKIQLSKLLTEFNASVVLAPKFEARDVSDFLKRAKPRFEPAVFALFQANLLAGVGDYKRASDILSTSSEGWLSSDAKPTNRRQWKK